MRSEKELMDLIMSKAREDENIHAVAVDVSRIYDFIIVSIRVENT